MTAFELEMAYASGRLKVGTCVVLNEDCSNTFAVVIGIKRLGGTLYVAYAWDVTSFKHGTYRYATNIKRILIQD